ncbi:MAG: membrane integrity-associated transporter subunit PqiC [Opitutales bacterium]
MFRKLPALLAATAFLLWLSACVNLKPKASLSKSYTLGPIEAVAPGKAQSQEHQLYILHPQIPAYLDGPRLGYRLASGEVKNMEGARWAEPLAEGIARAMALFMSESSLIRVVGHYPSPNTRPEASRLALNFQRFGATASGEIQVLVNWELRPAEGEVRRGQFVSAGLTWVVGDSDSLVQAYNQALHGLTLELAKAMALLD